MLQQYKRILVAVDGSKEAEQAFKKAIQVAKRNDGALGLVHVIDTRAFSSVANYDTSMADKATEYADELLNGYKEDAMKDGVSKVETYIEYGSPKTAITKEAANAFQADLIMCGATGLNAVERLLIGSVSEYVIRHSPCDVLVVRNEEPEYN
ncbi:universal stress protein [Listeria kieliensis]|uniref:Universal stress protein n=1 Tax=Listeria kieliensis TaxID=1621700 RepID=A0A3D8TUT0_9LIST|nr:universal stress protein [Listeria kieliensis]RDX02761.1 universal stress protein UspA [Listeria kieliensis]